LAQYYMECGQLSKAEFFVIQATQIDPTSAKDIYLLGVIREAKGKEEEAVALYNRAMQLSPTYWPPYLALGAIHEKRGRIAEAEAKYTAGLRVAPQEGELLYALGMLHARQGRLWLAIHYLAKAYEIKPDLPFLKNNLYLALSQAAQLSANQRNRLWRELERMTSPAETRHMKMILDLMGPPTRQNGR
ncbi:MAG: tetratricopeptide repeat protein, partial [Candidatus Methanomethyliaceae archaeon]